jgi:hypothetical protein
MSTYANGTQQTYQQIWASMEDSCAGLMAAIRAGASPIDETTSQPAAIDWPGRSAGGHRRHPLRSPRRSARGRRRIAARIH